MGDHFVAANSEDLVVLTSTEKRVLEAFAEGQTRSEIAKSLSLAPSTVGRALTEAKEKLGAKSPAEAAVSYKQALHERASTNALFHKRHILTADQGRGQIVPRGSVWTLSPRQAAIMALLASDVPVKQIARELGISEHTVRSHLKRLYQAHGLHSRAAAVAAYLRSSAIS